MSRPLVAPALGRGLTRDLVEWYRSARRDLPWRRVRDPYAIWVSETMLQQTRVQTVVSYYDRFMQEFPTLGSLAEAPEERVLALWSGLGYYRRARMMHAAAKRVASVHGGQMPSEVGELRRLEGVGRYTAGAIASVAFGRRAPAVDGNVERVLSRLFVISDDVKSASGSKRVWALATELVSAVDGDPGDWTQAVMELGATICLPREPRCGSCPVRRHCEAERRGVAAQLPTVRVKPPPRAVHRSAIVLASGQAVLLARRRRGPFDGLWEPPCSDEGIASLAVRLDLDEGGLRVAGEVVHVLSHRRMHVEVARGPLPERTRWSVPGPDYDAIEVVSLRDLPRRPRSTLALKVLILANVAASGLPSRR